MGFATGEDGVALWYETYGVADGEPLVLIAGQALSRRAWEWVVPQFAARHRVIVFDHRGVGQSDDSVPANWSTRDFAGDVIMLLDHLAVDRAHVYGYSMGGRIAQWLAADAPDRVRSLTLGATTVGDAGGVTRGPSATKALLSGNDETLRELFFSPAWISEHAQVADTVLPQARSAKGLKAHFQASARHDAREALAMIKAPTLIIHGTEDALCPPENGRILAGGITDAALHLVDGARHGYYLEYPESNDVVLEHLANTP